MGDWILSFLQYYLLALFYTLGAIVICGLAAHLSTKAFIYLTGGGKFVYVTSVIGTPIHELGHALMCLFFGHKITDMKLLLPPRNASGALGYVSHSYSRKNPWAVLGNLFIGVGPIFSGLAVIVLALVLCFPTQWNAYLLSTTALDGGESLSEIAKAVFSLLLSIPKAFENSPWRALIGMIVILFVAQHITLSTADIKGALSAFPLYLLLLLIFTIPTKLLCVDGIMLEGLFHFHIWMLSFFALSIVFSLCWLIPALLIRGIRALLGR
ncbi:MAG: hypothetical protein E7643_03670 [Ruminococcaceae bacterium]|nr:hypothetical protein [Oscillospiraceae bacterium]